MDHDDDDLTGDGEVPWLRDMVGEDLLGLFSDANEEVARTARHLVIRAGDDPALVDELIDALRTSIGHGNDDTQASVWIAAVLGEFGDTAALSVLFQGLGGDDETIQEASADAILKIGPPAIDALLDQLDEEQTPQFVEAAYRVLSSVGSLGDAGVLRRTMDFLCDRVESESAKPRDETRIEGLFQASALLGDRRMLESMDRVLHGRFGGKNAAIRDSREMLSENAEGRPLVHDKPPWIEVYRWLFEEDLESSRVKGRRSPGESREETAGGDVEPRRRADDDDRLSSLYWGLGSTLDRGADDPLDARRFLDRPRKRRKEDDG